jgi:uncharacterized protein
MGLKKFDAALFDDMPWSTSTVAQKTLKSIQRLGWQVKVLPTLHDIDEPTDLKHLPTEWHDRNLVT